jgi:hypothetical protein
VLIKIPRPLLSIFVSACALGAIAVPSLAQCPPGPATGNPAVLTSQYDNQRDGLNSNEVCLTAAALGSGSVILSQTRLLEVDDNPAELPTLPSGQQALSNPIYAQPLYVPQVVIGGTPHNILIAATMNDTVFAWDADTGGCTTSAQPVCNPPLWARQASNINPTYAPGPQGTNALWYDDCPGGHPPSGPGFLSFKGIISTPVVDVSLNSIFAVAYCVSSQGTYGFYLHQLSLTDGHDLAVVPIETNPDQPPASLGDADGPATGYLAFQARKEHQRAALLEANSLIYIAFGVGASEDADSDNPYHGWLFAYDVSSGLLPPYPVVNFVSTPNACGSGGGTNVAKPQCSGAGTGAPPCDCRIEHLRGRTFPNAPNWGGHGGGIWMSGRGPAASAMSDGNTHVFLGVGNGGFQSSPYNWGQSILDFRAPPIGANADALPFQSFTPQGGPEGCPGSGSPCSPAVQPPAAVACNSFNEGQSSPVPCSYTVQTLNADDWDMSVSGILLFNDLNGVPRLLTFDKSGYGYLATQGNLCGAPNALTLPTDQCAGPLNPSGTVPGFAPGDAGNAFPFLAAKVACKNGPRACDRITSLAFYDNYLYLWPYNAAANNEQLTAFQLSDNVSQWPGLTQLGQLALIQSSTAGGVTTVQFAACPPGDVCDFTTQLVPGDQLTAAGNPPQTGTVTSVSAAQLTLTGFGADVSGASFTYSGYFVNPVYEVAPPPATTGYAGGSLVVSASSPNSGDGVVWALIASHLTAEGQLSNENIRTPGTLYAYQANPTTGAPSVLPLLWSTAPADCPNCQSFCASSFALPTVAHGQVFVPTFAINLPQSASGYCPPSTLGSYQSGILVYGPQSVQAGSGKKK